MRLDGTFIGIEVGDAAAADAAIAAKLAEVCPVDIFTVDGGALKLVEGNLDEGDVDENDGSQPAEHQKVRHGGGKPRARDPHGGKAEIAEDQQPVDQRIEHQRHQGDHHHRFGLIQAGAVAIQHAVTAKSG